MFATSDLHKNIYADPAHVVQSKVTIAGTDYMEGEGLWDLSITGGLYAEDHPCIGGAVSREIDLELRNPGEIPRMAKMEVFARVALVDPITGETTSAAEWIPRGVFYIATRSFDASGEFLTIHGYDDMLKAEQPFLDQETGETGLWPMPMDSVAAYCALKMGVLIDPRSTFNITSDISYPSDYTCRELLQHIAAAHAGNWTMSCEGKLWLRPLADPDADVMDIGEEAMDLSTSPLLAAISMVRLWADDEHCYEAGDDTGRLLEADCPWATQNIAESVLEAVRGLSYVPMEVTDAFIDPAVELGDLLTITGITSPIGSMTETFGADYSATISAPADDEVDTEYPYTPSTTRKFDRKLATTKAEIKVTTDKIQSSVKDMEGNMSLIDQKVNGITLSVSDAKNDGTNTFVEIALIVEGIVTSKGQVAIDGNLDVSGDLSAEAMYAAMGDIADLTVDKLSTSRRVVKYLANDQTDDNYVRIRDARIEFVSGVYAGGEEQARNPKGGLIYWERDISDASIGSDGYPRSGGVRVFTTTEKTDWPVMVYTYEEQVKRSIAFDKLGDHYVPVDTFGAGDAAGRQCGRLVKDTDGLQMTYETQSGNVLGVRMGDDGYTDVYGMRKTTGMNFSEWEKGKFFERIDGDDTRYEYGVEFDAEGRPIKITDSAGHEMAIYW